jgi:hypothetical protein
MKRNIDKRERERERERRWLEMIFFFSERGIGVDTNNIFL